MVLGYILQQLLCGYDVWYGALDAILHDKRFVLLY